MTNRWANRDDTGTGDVFHALHAGLTVELIATKLPQLMTCAPDEPLSVVKARNTEPYDFLPVLAPGDGGRDRIVGLFHAAKVFDETPADGRIEQHYAPLSEDCLIGADTSILNFVTDADEMPCRLVISGARIVGLVSLSDLEIAMFEAIKRECPNDDDGSATLDESNGRELDEGERVAVEVLPVLGQSGSG